RLSDQYHLGMVAARRLIGNELLVPSVLHWKEHHFVAILDHKGDEYLVFDPAESTSRWLNGDAVNARCSGDFLVRADQIGAGWLRLQTLEAEYIFGGNDIVFQGCNDDCEDDCPT